MVVRKAEMLSIECIVRGYLSGSAWAEYAALPDRCTATRFPAGLRQSARLPESGLTPSTKAAEGHDENISFEAAVELIGIRTWRPRKPGASAWTPTSLAADLAAERGIIIADTKFELGADRRAAVSCATKC